MMSERVYEQFERVSEDEEVQAMSVIVALLNRLSPDARLRVANYVASRAAAELGRSVGP
jgi:hypothetical protein